MLMDYKEIFEIFDEDGNGTISKYEIAKVMTALGEKATQSGINAMME